MEYILKEFFYGLDFSDAMPVSTFQAIKPTCVQCDETNEVQVFEEEFINPYE